MRFLQRLMFSCGELFHFCFHEKWRTHKIYNRIFWCSFVQSRWIKISRGSTVPRHPCVLTICSTNFRARAPIRMMWRLIMCYAEQFPILSITILRIRQYSTCALQSNTILPACTVSDSIGNKICCHCD